MKKLLNTLFVLSETRYLALENENVLVLDGDEKIARFPLIGLEGIVTFSYKGASPALMGACAQRGIQLAFMTPNGRFLARVCGEDRGNVLLRKQQYRISDDSAASCVLARMCVFGKVYNSRWVLGRALRDHALRVDAQRMSAAAQRMADSLSAIAAAEDLEALRGLEGEAAQRYFGVFDDLILNNKSDFHFEDRSRRPPTDSVNAMLSFGYAILANDCASAHPPVLIPAFAMAIDGSNLR